MTTVGEATSRVRGVLKAVKEDPFITDRFLYSLILKYGKTLMKRQDNENKIMQYRSLFKQVPCIDLIEVDRIEACCLGIKTGCTFMRTREKLPGILEGSDGPIIRSVTTLDQSERLEETHPSTYANMTKSTYFKYNKNKYYWYIDGHIYIPAVQWEGIRLEAIFEDDINPLLCTEESTKCVRAQDREFGFPDWLFSEIEAMVKQELLPTAQLPSDGADDSQNVMR